MFHRFEWMMAARYLRARRTEGFISVIAVFSFCGIALGVATLIIVMSVMNGFRAELLGRILGINGHFVVRAFEGNLVPHAEVNERVRKLPGVVASGPVIEGQVMAMANNRARGALIRGTRPEDLRRRPLVSQKIVAGSLADFEGKNAILVGARLASGLGVGVGDRLTLVAPQNTSTPFGSVPRHKAYRIVATFQVGMYEYDSSYVFMPLKAAQIFFRTADQVSGVEIMVDDPDDVARHRRALVRAVGDLGRVVTWRQVNQHFFNALQVERNVMFMILTLIILIAAFNIISSLIMLVKDKAKQIAILRTMGATRGAVMRIFLLAGASIGVAGTIAGLILGVVFCLNIETIRRLLERLTDTNLFAAEIYFLSRLPAKIDANEVVAIVAMALVLSFLATLYPSWRAASLDPVDALRYE